MGTDSYSNSYTDTDIGHKILLKNKDTNMVRTR